MSALRITILTGSALILFASSSAYAQGVSFLCRFTSGPRAGQIQDYTGHPQGPLPVGYPCQDGMASSGVIIPAGSTGGASGGGDAGGGYPGGAGHSGPASSPCRNPSTEEDCDTCSSEASYNRCLEKLE
jgi:hypothetical protein